MATFCSHCGQELPRDDARFCNNCGAVRSSQVANPRSFAGTDNNRPLSVVMQAGEAQGAAQGQTVPALPGPVPPMWSHPGRGQSNAGDPAQLDFPALPATPQPSSPVVPQSLSPARELRVKVWRDAKSSPGEFAEVGAAPQSDVRATVSDNRESTRPASGEPLVEDLPTRPVESMAVPQPPQTDFPIDDIPTTPLLTLSTEQAQSVREHYGHTQQTPTRQADINPMDSTGDIANISTVHLQVQGQKQARAAAFPQPQIDHAPVRKDVATPVPRSKKRLPLIIGATAVLLLLLLALGSWIVAVQPFRVSPATDVQQSFTDSKLGVALRYPNGWKQPQVDYNKKSITLQDASETAQMSVRIGDPTTEAPESYLQKQAAQIGINNPKPGAIASFGGTSWQELQGDAQVKGAEYTCALFTTTYKNHLYTIIQLAPRSIYSDEEKLVFSPTRQSLHFI